MRREPGAVGASRLRWSVKKAARTGFALGGSASRWLGPRAGAPRVHVLTYHHFGTASRDPFCVSHPDFEAQMAWLAGRGLAVTLADVEAFVAGERTLPDGAVLVTVDDGLRSLYLHALPVLQRHGIPAAAFVPAGAVREHRNSGSSEVEADRAPLTWSELAAVTAAGITIGSHAWTHRSLGRLGPEEVRDQLVRSRETLEQRLGQRVTALAYPFGTRADYNAMTATICRETGYTCAFTSQHGAIRPGDDPLTLPRVKVEGGEAPWMFGLLCDGALDGWRWVDRTLWRLQEAGR